MEVQFCAEVGTLVEIEFCLEVLLFVVVEFLSLRFVFFLRSGRIFVWTWRLCGSVVCGIAVF